MSQQTRKVLYLSHASEEVYEIIRAQVARGFELITLESDDDAERLAKIADVQVVICASTPLTGPMIAAADKLELVHHQGVGYQDTLDVANLRDRALPLALTPEGTTVAVAEHTVMLMIAALRHVAFADAELRQGRWHVNSLRPVSRELAGRCVGYVGMGRIGQAVAERLKAFGTHGIYTDPVALPEARARALGVRRGGMEEVLETAEVLTLHTPLTRETRHMIDGRAIARMKPGVVIVNTARGGLVSEPDLVAGLRAGRVAAAGLDVFDGEPPALDNPLLSLPNVVLTPHISAGTRDTLGTKMHAVFDNIQRFYRGEPMRNAVDLTAETSNGAG